MGDFDYQKEYENWKWNIPEHFNNESDIGEGLQMETLKFMTEKASPNKYPGEIDFVKELPKTQSGKIKRKLLREAEIEKKKV